MALGKTNSPTSTTSPRSPKRLRKWPSNKRLPRPAECTNLVWTDLVVLDIDPRHGGHETLKVMVATHGAFPPTIESVTGGGGQHLFFKHPGIAICNDTGRRLGSGLDVWGDGRYVV